MKIGTLRAKWAATVSLSNLCWRVVIQFCRQKPLGAVGGFALVVTILVAILAPVIAPYDQSFDVPNRLQAPSLSHFMGTDDFGRDVFTRVLFGSRLSLYVGFLSVALGSLAGTLVGSVSGFLGGKWDTVIQRFVDALLGFPSLVLAIVVVAGLGVSMNNVMIAIMIVFVPQIARVARSAVLSVREEDYVLAAFSLGATRTRTLFRHILPNSLAPIMILATGYLGTAVITEASLSFLGLGVPPPQASWGQMLQSGARLYFERAPWLAIFPGLAIAAVVFAFNVFGDALRDYVDPRLRGAR